MVDNPSGVTEPGLLASCIIISIKIRIGENRMGFQTDMNPNDIPFMVPSVLRMCLQELTMYPSLDWNTDTSQDDPPIFWKPYTEISGLPDKDWQAKNYFYDVTNDMIDSAAIYQELIETQLCIVRIAVPDDCTYYFLIVGSEEGIVAVTSEGADGFRKFLKQEDPDGVCEWLEVKESSD